MRNMRRDFVPFKVGGRIGFACQNLKIMLAFHGFREEDPLLISPVIMEMRQKEYELVEMKPSRVEPFGCLHHEQSL